MICLFIQSEGLLEACIFLLLTRWTYSISTFGPLVTNLCLTFWLRSCALFGFGPLVSDCQHIQHISISHSAGLLKDWKQRVFLQSKRRKSWDDGGTGQIMTTFTACQIYLKVPYICMMALQHEWTLIFIWGKPDHSSHPMGRWFGTGLWHTWPVSELWQCSLTHWEYPDLSSFTKSQAGIQITCDITL